MALENITSRESVINATKEYDKIGKERFLQKYEFGPATRYYLKFGGRLYPSKAILGAAHGYQFPDDGWLTAHHFNGSDPVLRKCQELQFDIVDLPAANRVTTEQVKAIEGNQVPVVHLRRERSRSLVRAKIAAALAIGNGLKCEACEFDYSTRYGQRGARFIECHHTKPLETLGDGTPTLLDDLALLCANCHRMIHVRRPWLSVAQLRVLIRP